MLIYYIVYNDKTSSDGQRCGCPATRSGHMSFPGPPEFSVVRGVAVPDAAVADSSVILAQTQPVVSPSTIPAISVPVGPLATASIAQRG